MANYYNDAYDPFIHVFNRTRTWTDFECKIIGFLSKSYGKWGEDQASKQVVMEFSQMFPFMSDYLNTRVRQS